MKREMEEYFHVCTDGLSKSLLYHDEPDYICGMNDVPVSLSMTKATMLCFCLMSNHVHFVLQGREEECQKFIVDFKRRTSRRLKIKYADVHSLHKLGTAVKRIETTEYLLTAIAYVLRNPFILRGARCLPTNYKWGSGSLYFNCSTSPTMFKPISDLTLEDTREMFRTRTMLPQNYLVDTEGMIFPGSYVAVKEVEKLFGSPRQFLFHLSKNDDGKFEIEHGIVNRISFSDMEAKSLILRTCRDYFNVGSLDELTLKDKCRLGVLLHKRYGIGPKQFARISNIEFDVLQRIMV